MLPVVAHANPVSVNGQSLIAFAIAAFWALALLLWVSIIGAVAYLSATDYRHAKKLVERTHENTG